MSSLEKIILRHLNRNEDYARTIFPHLKSEYFEDEVHRIYFNILKDHFEEYNKLPSANTISVIIQEQKVTEKIFKDLAKFSIEVFSGKLEKNVDWLVDKTEEFCKNRAMYNAICEAADIIQRDQTNSDNIMRSAIPEMMSSALAVSFDSQVGHDYIENSDDRFKMYKERIDKIPFHIPSLNNITNGGIERKTINCILAPTGAGKTMMLCDLAANWMKSGYNVLYITNEMAEEKIGLRIDANLLNINMSDIKDLKHKDWNSKISNLKKKLLGKLKIKEYPTSTAHVGNFRYLLKELKQKQGFIPDVIVIDYLNICASAKYKDKSNSYGYIKSVTEEIRGFATENNVAIMTATQTNRCLDLNSIVYERKRGEIKISDLKLDDEVLGDSGYNTVKKIYPIEKQKVYKIRTKSGKEIICSSKHIFPSSRGLSSISQGLCVGDYLTSSSS